MSKYQSLKRWYLFLKPRCMEQCQLEEAESQEYWNFINWKKYV